MGRARFAAIDVGSNAMRLRIADRVGSGFVDVATERAAVRLGHDAFGSGVFTRATLDAACRALAGFCAKMDRFGVTAHRAVATSATREASNGALLCERAFDEAGIDLEAIDGIEEARLVRIAVTRAVKLVGRTALVDIGGGSTEVTILDDARPIASASLPLGTVRLLEAWHPEGGTIGRRRLGVLGDVVDRALADAAPPFEGVDQIVATGGAASALAKICADEDDGFVCVANLDQVVDRLRRMNEAERTRTFGLRVDKSDTIIPGAVVLRRIIAAAGVSSILAPRVGLREGILVDLANSQGYRARTTNHVGAAAS